MADLHPLTGENYLIQTLLARLDGELQALGSDIRIGGRIDAADQAAKNPSWPFIIHSPMAASFDSMAEQVIEAVDDVLVRAVMREDKVPASQDLKNYTATIARALLRCLEGVDNSARAGTGTTHGCEIVDRYRPALYGDEGRRVCEMGYVVRIVTS